MGVVFGKQTVAEPAYDVILKRTVGVPYEIRRYGIRFAAETAFASNGNEDDDSTPFRLLARYIGVFGSPENEGQEAISMTAPVMKEGGGTSTKEPVKIAMTAPVMKQGDNNEQKTMAFVLPAEYDSLAKIPKPTNPLVHIKQIPSQVGVVHRYSGSFSDEISEAKAKELAKQLRDDGLLSMTDEFAVGHHQFWGYNPPFTLPMFRRNEVWIELSEEQADQLVNGVSSKHAN